MCHFPNTKDVNKGGGNSGMVYINNNQKLHIKVSNNYVDVYIHMCVIRGQNVFYIVRYM